MPKKFFRFIIFASLLLFLFVLPTEDLTADEDLELQVRPMYYNSRDMILTLSATFSLPEDPLGEEKFIFYIPQIAENTPEETVLNLNENEMFSFSMNEETANQIVRVQLREPLPPGFKFLIPDPEPVIEEDPVYIKADPPEGVWENEKALVDLSVFTHPIGENVTWEAVWSAGTETPGPEAGWTDNSPVSLEQEENGIWYLHVKAQHSGSPEINQYFGPYNISFDYSLIVNSTEGGSVTDPGEDTYEYSYNHTVNLLAEPAIGYHFVDWSVSGGHEGGFNNINEADTTFIMPAEDVTVTANFAETTITFVPDGNSTWSQSHETDVTINAGSLVTTNEYQWTTSDDFPGEGPWETFTSGETIDAPSGETGSYYLHVKVTDQADPENVAQATSDEFNMDNTPPAITFTREIAIDSAKIDENLTKFPVLVKLDENNFDFSSTRADGYDVYFTGDDGTTLLDFERERHDTVNEAGEYWVKIPFVSASEDTVFHLHYGDPDAAMDMQSPEDVWDDNFMGVWHKDDGPEDTLFDSTVYENNVNKVTTNNPLEAEGIIGKGQSYNNSYASDTAEANLDGITGEFTMSAWYKPDGSDPGFMYILSKNTSTTGNMQYGFLIRNPDSGGNWGAYLDGTRRDLNSRSWTTGQWYYLTMTWDGSTLEGYVDGVFEDSTAHSGMTAVGADINIGRRSGSGNYFYGMLDEVRLSDTARSEAWINADYHSGNDNLLKHRYEQEHTVTVEVTDDHAGVDAGTLEYQWTDTDVFPAGGDWTGFSSGSIIEAPGGVTGTRYLHVKAADNAGNETEETSGAFNLDNTGPTVVFDPDGDTTYEQDHSTTVTVSDNHSGVDAGTLEYQWTDTDVFPAGGDWTGFSSGEEISTPGGLTGLYYLHVRVEDNAGNEATDYSEPFYMDNTPPTAPTLNLDDTWTSGNRSFTITGGSDGESGLSHLEYRTKFTGVSGMGTDWGTWETYTGEVTVTDEGITEVEARSVDNVGNVSATASGEARIDTTSPTIVFDPDGGDWNDSDPTTVTVTDPNVINSGLNPPTTVMRYQWSPLDAETKADRWTDFTSPDDISAPPVGLGAKEKLKITIDHNLIDEDLTDFPVAVKLNRANFDFSNTHEDGYDIRFSDADGTTLLDFERERHDTVNMVGEYWVKIPHVSSTRDTVFYLHYGDLDAVFWYLHVEAADVAGNIENDVSNAFYYDQLNPQDVWDDNFAGVWHKNDHDASTIHDSTSNANHGTKAGAGSPQETEGLIGKAQSYDGNNDYVDTGLSPSNMDAGGTASMWVWSENGDYAFGSHSNSSGGDNRYYIHTSWTWGLGNSFGSSFSLSQKQWVHLAMTFDGNGGVVIYVDGEVEQSAEGEYSIVGDNQAPPLYIGAYNRGDGDTDNFEGLIDEVRISDTVRSAAWIKADYHSGNDTLVSYSTVDLSDWSHHLEISIDSSKIDEDLTDFPVMVKLDDSNFDFSAARSDGHDVRFIGQNGEVLSYERERHDAGGEEAEYWVKIPHVSASEYSQEVLLSDGTFTVPAGVTEVDVLVVGGGGGGGYRHGAGGGAGGLIFESGLGVTPGESIPVTVGSGGTGATGTASQADSGEDSSFGAFTAAGGGGGGQWDNFRDGLAGGSGGGAAGGSAGSGTTGQGNAGGGSMSGSPYNWGGGGGAGEPGETGTEERVGEGGAGLYFGDLFGDNVGDNGWFAGGGGGGSHNPVPTLGNRGFGGAGGGGDGGTPGTPEDGGDGLPNTGGGGGGASTSSGGSNTGGDGGSGIVIVRYKLPQMFYMYYGNPDAADGENAADVWSNGYTGVWHKDDDDASTILDSTANANHGTKESANNPQETEGKIGPAQEYCGTIEGNYPPDCMITTGVNNRPANSFMFEAWVKAVNEDTIEDEGERYGGTSDQNYVFGAANGGASDVGAGLSVGTNGISVYEHGSGYMPPMAVHEEEIGTDWNHIAVVYYHKQPFIFLNGEFVREGLDSHSDHPRENVWAPYEIGGGWYGAFEGLIDETRVWVPPDIEDAEGIIAWIKASYHSGNDSLLSYNTMDLSNWSHNREIIIDSTKIDEDLQDFPVLVKLDGSNFHFSEAQSNGHDIRFKSHDGRILSYERERHDATAGEAEYWVKIPSVSSTGDTSFYIYYGNPDAPDGENAAAVWDDSYAGVWHKNDHDASTIHDSTSNANHGTKQAANNPEETDGKIGKGQLYDGNEYIRLSSFDGLSNQSQVTISYWIKHKGTGDNQYPLWANQNVLIHHATPVGGGSGWNDLRLRWHLEGDWRGTHFVGNILELDEWMHVAVTFNEGETRFYFNGELQYQGTDSQTSISDIYPHYDIGRRGTNQGVDGELDEFRISAKAKSAAWIRAEFHSGNNTLLKYQDIHLDDFLSRSEIRVSHTLIDEDLTDFPVLVKLDNTNFDFSKARADGYDVRFTAGDGVTLLDFERERHDQGGEVGEYWVKLPHVSSDVDTVFYLYYENSGATNAENSAAVWDDSYVGVWHKNDYDASTIHDSTSNANHGLKVAANNPWETDGKSGLAQEYDGASSRVELGNPNALQITGNQTIEMWLRPDALDARRNPYNKAYGGEGTITQETDGRLNYYWGEAGSNAHPYQGFSMTNHLVVGEWAHVTLVRDLDEAELRWYKNGVKTNDTATDFVEAVESGLDAIIGDGYTNNYDGLIDELRISGKAHSAAWIKANYHSGNNTLLTYNAIDLPEWTHRREIVIDSTKIDEDLTDFPLLVELNASNFDFSQARSDGHDIGFMSTDGRLYAFERERHDAENEEAEYWVRIPYVSADRDTVFYMYYGNPVFYDDFSTWEGWSNYSSGTVEQSSAQSKTGSYSLLKDNNNDPHGGWKALGKTVRRNYTLEGWIYSPDPRSGGAQDRLAISDGDFNGYGPRITGTTIAIERRSDRTDISATQSWTRPVNEWYRFVFKANPDNTFTLTTYDKDGVQLATVNSNPCDEHEGPFDRVVVHGGHEFYVDELKLVEDKSNPAAVWDDNFKGVWHKDDHDASTIHDSTSNANHGNKGAANQPFEAEGKIGKAQDFSTGDHFIDFYNTPAFPALTVETWVYPREDLFPYQGVWFGTATGNGGWMFYREGVYIGDGSSWIANTGFGNIPEDTWTHLTFTYDGQHLTTYKDGNLVSSSAGTGTISSSGLVARLGGPPPGTNWDAGYIDALFDEVRISDIARSPAWVKADYYSGEGDLISFSDEPEFPEGFEDGIFPPLGWRLNSFPGADGSHHWERTDSEKYAGDWSAYHHDTDIGTYADHLLIAKLYLPEDSDLVFRDYTRYPSFYDYHGVWIDDGRGYVELWNGLQDGTPVASWTERTVDLSAYTGQYVRIAFLYQGEYAHRWYIDEVDVVNGGSSEVYEIMSLESHEDGEPVAIPDSALEEAVRDALNRPTGDITKEMMASLKTLTAGGRGIADLTGIEYATGLEGLFLSNNFISDLSPLAQAELPDLKWLYLKNNMISDLSPLKEAKIPALKVLSLSFNLIEDLALFREMEEFDPERLFLNNNVIDDISVFAGTQFNALEFLSLSTNWVSDLSPLADAELPALRKLYLSSNEISDLSPLAESDLPAMEELVIAHNQDIDYSDGSPDMEIVERYRGSEKSEEIVAPEPDTDPDPEQEPEKPGDKQDSDDSAEPDEEKESDEPENVVNGDGYIITGNGEPAVRDAILILRHVAGLTDIKDEYGPEAFNRACLNGTETLKINDAILLLRIIVGLEPTS